MKVIVDEFYSSTLVFDLALQWTLKPGPLRYDFKWLTEKFDNPELVEYAKLQFQRFYCIDPDSCVLVDIPVAATTTGEMHSERIFEWFFSGGPPFVDAETFDKMALDLLRAFAKEAEDAAATEAEELVGAIRDSGKGEKPGTL